MEQLGPFHFFFTLSAAEMRWPEVTTAILHYEQKIEKILYQPGWEEDEEKIKIYSIGWEKDESKITNLMEGQNDAEVLGVENYFCGIHLDIEN